MGDQRPRQRHTLLLAARQRVHPLGAPALEAKALQQRLRLALRSSTAQALFHQAKGHVVLQAQVREQGKVLKHQGQAAFFRGPVADVLTVEPNTARLRCLQTRHDFQQRALAAARGAQQGHGLARFDAQVHVLKQGLALALGAKPVVGDVAQFKHEVNPGVERGEGHPALR